MSKILVDPVIVEQVSGNLTVAELFQFVMPFDGEISGVSGILGTAGGTNSTTIDVTVGGTSIFGAGSVLTFATDTATSAATSYLPEGILGKFNAGDVIAVEALTVGSTAAPADLAIAIAYKGDTNPY